MPARVSARMEDYLEAILAIGEGKPVVRAGQIAEALGVSRPTVTAALKTLVEGELVEHESYGYVRLTPRGRRAGGRVRRRHRLLRAFFQDVLGVAPDQATQDACRIEHYISKDTVDRLTRFVGSVADCPRCRAVGDRQ